MARSSRWTFLIGLAMAVALSVCPRATAQDNLSRKGYENVTSLKDAIEVVKKQLILDGKAQYAALITEDRVRDGIRTAISGYEAMPAKNGKPAPGTTDHWIKEVKPVYLKVADKGEWPASCTFGGFYKLVGRGGVPYDGLGLRLYAERPNAPPGHFALPILDLYFGHFAD
jgi:hypothetical protein